MFVNIRLLTLARTYKNEFALKRVSRIQKRGVKKIPDVRFVPERRVCSKKEKSDTSSG